MRLNHILKFNYTLIMQHVNSEFLYNNNVQLIQISSQAFKAFQTAESHCEDFSRSVYRAKICRLLWEIGQNVGKKAKQSVFETWLHQDAIGHIDWWLALSDTLAVLPVRPTRIIMSDNRCPTRMCLTLCV